MRPAAKLLAAHVAAAKLVNDKRKGKAVDLVLGNKYKGLQPLASTTPKPVATPTCRTVLPTTATPTGSSGATRPTVAPKKSTPAK